MNTNIQSKCDFLRRFWHFENGVEKFLNLQNCFSNELWPFSASKNDANFADLTSDSCCTRRDESNDPPQPPLWACSWCLFSWFCDSATVLCVFLTLLPTEMGHSHLPPCGHSGRDDTSQKKSPRRVASIVKCYWQKKTMWFIFCCLRSLLLDDEWRHKGWEFHHAQWHQWWLWTKGMGRWSPLWKVVIFFYRMNSTNICCFWEDARFNSCFFIYKWGTHCKCQNKKNNGQGRCVGVW